MVDTLSNKKVVSHCGVLGGGGVTGIAWMTGLLLGLEEQGLNLSVFDRLIGTSAGATVAAQISSGVSLGELFSRQIDEDKQVNEIIPAINYLKLLWAFAPALFFRTKPEKKRRYVGRQAQKLSTVAPEIRRNVIEQRLPVHRWPECDLNLVAVNAVTGAPRLINKVSGIPLIDAVAASCAVPGVWPPVAVDSEIYIDGGMYSTDNVVYAKGASSVLLISPLGASSRNESFNHQMSELKSDGAKICVIKPDKASKKAMGRNPLNPDKRTVSAIAGREQGLREASRVLREFVR